MAKAIKTPKTAAPATSDKPAAKGKAKAKPASKAKKSGFPSKAGGEGKPGVVASIIEFLQSATSKKPITKKDILAKLCERFPAREEKGMRVTIHCQIPSRLQQRELVVKSNDDGFWIE